MVEEVADLKREITTAEGRGFVSVIIVSVLFALGLPLVLL